MRCAGNLGADGPGREQVDSVANLAHFGEHYGGSGANQQISSVANGGIGGYSGERVATPALEPDHQLGCRTA